MVADLIAKSANRDAPNTPSQARPPPIDPSSVPFPDPLIVLPTLTIRPYHPSDADRLALLANNRNIARNNLNRFPHPYTLEDAHSWIARCSDPQGKHLDWAISQTPTGPIIGGCGFDPGVDVFSRNAEIGYWIGEPYWGNGYATIVVRALTDWSFNQEHGIVRDASDGEPLLRLGAGVFGGNPASERVLSKAGWSSTGVMKGIVFKFGEVRDLHIYGITRDESRAQKGHAGRVPG